MKRILVPVDGSEKGLAAVRAAVAMRGEGLAGIDLVNVQPRLNLHVSQFIARRTRDAWREDRARTALEPARRLVESAGIACRTHVATGEAERAISDLARLIRADEIVVGATRRGLLGRLLANSLSTRLLSEARVPVRVIPAAPTPPLERLAVPASVGLGVALFVMAND